IIGAEASACGLTTAIKLTRLRGSPRASAWLARPPPEPSQAGKYPAYAVPVLLHFRWPDEKYSKFGRSCPGHAAEVSGLFSLDCREAVANRQKGREQSGGSLLITGDVAAQTGRFDRRS